MRRPGLCSVDVAAGMSGCDPGQSIREMGERIDVTQHAGLAETRRQTSARHHPRTPQTARCCDSA